MKADQRVVKSIPDRNGNAYTKTSAGGKARMQAAANYMDEREYTQLYKLEHGVLRATDRYQAAAEIEGTETRYQQHLTFTTKLDSAVTFINERVAAEHVARSIQGRRPDAEIYAVAVHSDGKGEEKGVHVHVIVGTRTTLRRDDLSYFREEACRLERELEHDNVLEFSELELKWIRERRVERQTEHTNTAPRRSLELE